MQSSSVISSIMQPIDDRRKKVMKYRSRHCCWTPVLSICWHVQCKKLFDPCDPCDHGRSDNGHTSRRRSKHRVSSSQIRPHIRLDLIAACTCNRSKVLTLRHFVSEGHGVTVHVIRRIAICRPTDFQVATFESSNNGWCAPSTVSISWHLYLCISSTVSISW
jgi:hypothetical protein